MFTKKRSIRPRPARGRGRNVLALGLALVSGTSALGPCVTEAQDRKLLESRVPVVTAPVVTKPIVEAKPSKPRWHPAFEAKLKDPGNYLVSMFGDDESACGDDDTQHVRDYDGALGQTQEFVARHKGPVGRLRTGVNCTGTLIARDLFLTASHCVDSRTSQDKVYFNHEKLAGDTVVNDEAIAYDVVEIVEDGIQMGLDYAVLRLADRAGQANTSPGDTFGVARLEEFSPPLGHVITIIQHPGGRPKVVDVGHVDRYDPVFMFYKDLDTEGGSSGAGVLDEAGRLVAVHVQGGCDQGIGNSAVRMDRIASVSPTIRGLLPPTILARRARVRELHVSDQGLKYGQAGDELSAEAMFLLEGTKELFGFTLRPGTDEEAHIGMLDILRTAFRKNEPVHVEYDRETYSTNRVFRVIRN